MHFNGKELVLKLLYFVVGDKKKETKTRYKKDIKDKDKNDEKKERKRERDL